MLSYYAGWNYILELYFWIIIAALLIVSITIFFARPKPSTPPITEMETSFGTGTETDTISKKEATNLKIEKETSKEPEDEEKDPENLELLTEEGRAIRDFAEENEDEYFSEEYNTDSKEGEE